MEDGSNPGIRAAFSQKSSLLERMQKGNEPYSLVAEKPKIQPLEIPTKEVSASQVDENGTLTVITKDDFANKKESKYKLVSANGNSKTLYQEEGSDSLLAILKRDPKQYKQSLDQIAFYKKYNHLPEFRKVVVPLNGILTDQNKQIVGVEYPSFGISISDFIKSGRTLDIRVIDEFVYNYGRLIAETGFAHGDFVVGGDMAVADHQNLRIDPQTHTLKFIDYNGQGGTMKFDGQAIPADPGPDGKPTNKAYRDLARNEHIRLRDTLYKLFGK